jgi:hypothetical protein
MNVPIIDAIHRLRLKPENEPPNMTPVIDLACGIAWLTLELILEYPRETFRVAGIAGVIGLCAYFGREPRKRRA